MSAADTPHPAEGATLTDEQRTELQRTAAANARRVRDESATHREQDIAAFMREMQEIAVKRTGLTVDEIEALKPEIEQEKAGLSPQPVRVSRQTVADRGVPELHLRHVYDTPAVECDALARVRGLLAGDRTLLVLSGGVGTRKSGSACWALTQRAGRYLTAGDLKRLAVARDEDGLRDYRQLKRADVVIIDDLGANFVDDKGWFVSEVTDIIDARYAACAKTIIATNLDAATFKQTYGERIADRIREAGHFCDIAGESVRRRADRK